MLYTKKNIESIVLKVVGKNQLEALGLPLALEESALLLFIGEVKDIKEEEILLIKESVIDVREHGCISFSVEDVPAHWSVSHQEGRDSYRLNPDEKNCQYEKGSVYFDCWHDGWNEESNKKIKLVFHFTYF